MPTKCNFIEDDTVELNCEIVDPFNILSRFNLNHRDLTDLCGGIPSEDINRFHLKASSSYEGAFHIEIKTNLYELVRTIDFEMKFIDNQFMRVYDTGNGIGTTLFLNQIKAAGRLGFEKLRTVASAPDPGDDDSDWIGYYCWGRLGYVMTHDEQADFERWAENNECSEKTLNDLLLESAEGRELWRKGGYTWIGEFILFDGSPSMDYLRKYLNEKGIEFNPGQFF